MKRLDRYIIFKFLGTFFFSIVLIMAIAIVFDLTEKMDDFYEAQLTWQEVIMGYYIYFVPYYMNMFSSLFIFISVIFFTSKLAANSEIIAILAAGVSFRRLMLPYFLSALLLFIMSFLMAGYIIPPASGKLLSFEDKYVSKFKSENVRNVQMELEPGLVLYIESFQKRSNSGVRTSLERFEGKSLRSRITAQAIRYDSLYYWHFDQYEKRDFDGLHENIERGARLDTVLQIQPYELFITAEEAQQMTNPELREHINKQRERGTGNVQAFETEWHKRLASPLAAFIMTLLGVTLSCRKSKGGMGKNLGIGLTLSAGYILFSTVSTTFAVSGSMTPFMAVWLPNFIFLAIGIFLYIQAPK
ncbi:MAG: LptF/LptG family permease [Paludibacteraceae bacterium]|nr:LptF/LptG family permease [Paludibacteraceae bacterium]MBR1785895.1 LptF/LptG family permease [Paludibacteraceae bacterium]